nr:minor coat protein [Sweet potato chlorotic stunt virus]QYA73060.1 minor coat protein [Sweet potato chlorotic stunt virus]QYA73206.1 minor coat protein [Sweet potato chlorotic stunt virus]QYA73216.1 minor coat protein [Sweet potato chlorotic stunt virus]
MDILELEVGNIISTNYPDDETEIVTRAVGCKFNQDYSLPYKDREQVDFSIPYTSALRSKPVTIELYFHIGSGYVVYTCKPVDNFNQKIYESNLGSFFSSFRNLVTPRRPRGMNAFRFGYLREGNDCFIIVEGWRVVQIPNANTIFGVSLRLSLDIGDVIFSKSDKLSANQIALDSCLECTRPDGLLKGAKPKSVNIFSETTQENAKVTPIGDIPLSVFNSVTNLNLKILRNGDDSASGKDETQIDKDRTTMSNEEDKKKIFRIYYSNFLDSGFKNSLNYTIHWPQISCNGVDVNHQFWIGDREDMFEGGVHYIHTTSTNTIFFVHRKGDVSEYFKINEEQSARILKTIPTELTFSVVKNPGSKYVVYVNGEKFLTAFLPIVGTKVQIGWEIKLYKDKVKSFEKSKLKTFEIVPRETQVKSDSELVALRRYEFGITDFNASGWVLEKKLGLRLKTIKHVNELFTDDIPPEKEEQVDKTDKQDKKTPEEKIDDTVVVDKAEDVKENSEEFALKAVVYQPLSKLEDEKIFNNMIKYYESKGLTQRQAELLIYQMGVSFCTSVNSCANSNLHLIVSKPDGSLLKVSKSDHVMRMQMLCKKYCNVERTLLRNRSDKIFRLLKAKVLVLPLKHARVRGIKPEMAHMACDFMDYTTIPLSDEEVLALNSIQRFVLMRNKHRRSIVNVNQLF